MGGFLTIVVLIACIALIFFVLVQNPKGGGLNSEFGSAVQLGGAKRATDILEKGTWGLAIAIAVICLGMAAGGNGSVKTDTEGFETDASEITTEEEAGGGQELPTAPTGGLPPVGGN